jgi:hypothetical protein
MMMTKTPKVLAAGAIAALALTGCSYRTVDPATSGATPVAGTGVLHRFCDQSTLIYVSIVPSEPDNFEAFFYGGCAKDAAGTWKPAIDAPAPVRQEDTNQQDERDEAN